MIDWLKEKLGRFNAASKLAPLPPPKVRGTQQAYPSYLRNTQGGNANSSLTRADRRLATTDLLSLRLGQDSRQIIRGFVAASPDLSAAVNAYVRTAITSSYKCKAFNSDGTFNREATQLALELLHRFDVVQDYADGFSGIWSTRSTSEALARELVTYGACSLELVLGKDRLPRTFLPISVRDIEFREDGKWLKPIQRIGSEVVDLDQPTFFYTSVDQDLKEAYADSPLEAALQPVIADFDFQNDLRRVIKRAIHPRMDVAIDMEKFKKNIPAEYLHDAEALNNYMTSVIAEIETRVNGLNPEDALVHFDFIKLAYINNGGSQLNQEYEVLQGILNSKMATGAKTLPSILGHSSASQNIASSETLLFMKNADGLVRMKLNEIYSRALTLAVRLFGLDIYVEFAYDPIDLRPTNELEAFFAMKQSRILELLSLGLMTDDEASIELTGKLPPATAQSLSGTFFKAGGGQAGANNPYSTTGAGANTQGAMNESLKPDTPQQPKGPAKQAAVDFNIIAMNKTVGNAVEGNQELAKGLLDANKQMAQLISDQTYAISRQAHKPVNVSVEPSKVDLNLSIEQKGGKKKTVTIHRDEDGRFMNASIVEDEDDE